MQNSRTYKHIPNLLSLSRIVLAIAFFILFRQGSVTGTAVCLGIIIAGMITDYLDGAVARRNQLVTMAGKWIDPLCDFSFFFFVYLSFFTASLMPLVLLILFLFRELSMYMIVRPLYIKRHLDPAAKIPGKLKTVFQNAGSAIITVLVIGFHLKLLTFSTLRVICLPLLSAMVAISLASMYWYVRPLIGKPGNGPDLREARGRLLKPLLGTIFPLFLLFSLYAYLMALRYSLPMRGFAIYVLLNCLFHGSIVLASLIVAGEFRLEGSEVILSRINLPLFLSFCRVCAVPTLIFLFLFVESINAAVALVPLLAFIFLTDLFDGLLARTLGQTTRIGRILDAAGDYVLIFAISWVYLAIDFVPTWLFVLIIIRLVVQAAGIITLYILRGYSTLRLSLLGKASVFAVFTLYGIELLEFLEVPGLGTAAVVRILEIATAGIVCASLAEKILYLIRSFAEAFGASSITEDQ